MKRRNNSKKAKEIISHVPDGFTVAVEDESMFIHDALIRRMWTPNGKRPIVTVTGSHQKTFVFGTLTMDGKQFFRQYDVFNQSSFLKYLKELQRNNSLHLLKKLQMQQA
jgi:DDE superfamily endonuclease